MEAALKLQTNSREIQPLSRLRHRFESGWGYHQSSLKLSDQSLGSRELRTQAKRLPFFTHFYPDLPTFTDRGVNSVRTKSFTWAGALGATRLSVLGHLPFPSERRTNGRPILPPAFQATHEQRGDMVDEIFEGEFTLDIVNFTKHNPGKTSGWIKLQNDWFDDPAIVRLTPTERYLFVTLLSLRGNKQEPIRNLCVTSLQHRVNLPGRSLKRSLLRMWKEGLISLERKKEREERGDEEGLGGSRSLIIPDLVGIDDPLFQTMSEAAQRSWVGKFGLALIRDIVPTAHTSWKTDNPINPRSGVPVPLIPYVHRWLENGKRFPQKPKEKTFAEALAEREAKREQADI